MAKLKEKMMGGNIDPEAGEITFNDKNQEQDHLKLSRADSSVKSLQ